LRVIPNLFSYFCLIDNPSAPISISFLWYCSKPFLKKNQIAIKKRGPQR
jgi:hypothetical protein